jgi:hypothetical protein
MEMGLLYRCSSQEGKCDIAYDIQGNFPVARAVMDWSFAELSMSHEHMRMHY